MSEDIEDIRRSPRLPRLHRLAGAALAALLVATLLLAAFAPRYWAWPALDVPDLHRFPEVNRAADAVRQLRDPFVDVPNPSNRVIEWRLLPPLLGKLLGLPREVFLALPHLGCLVVLAACFHLVRRGTGRLGEALLATTACGAASWFFVSTGWLAYFDSWMVAGALVAAFARSRAALVAAVVLTPWIDERFLLALPALLVVRLALHAADGGPQGVGAFQGGSRGAPEGPDSGEMPLPARHRTRKWLDLRHLRPVSDDLRSPSRAADGARPRRDLAASGLAALPYVVIRLGAALLAEGDESGAYLADWIRELGALRDEARLRPLTGLWQSLRGGWLLVACWLAWLARALRPRLAVLTVGGTLASMALGLFAAGDFSRSQSAFLPLAVAGALVLGRGARRRALVVTACAALLGLLAPARHVVSAFEVPVRSLPSERRTAREPPPFLDPKARAWRAMEHEKRGEIDLAVADLRAAEVLAPQAPAPSLLLARVLQRAGRLEQARAAARRAVRKGGGDEARELLESLDGAESRSGASPAPGP